MRTWVLFVNSNFQAWIGKSFYVETSDEGNIADLKDKVKEKSPETLSRAHADAFDLTVWRLKGDITISESTLLAEIHKSDNAIEELSPRQLLADLGLSNNQTLILQLPPRTPGDEVSELKEFERYRKTLTSPGPSPSEGAKSTGYRGIQSNVDQVIYDGRRAPGGVASTIAPPIQIFHPVFNDFITSINHSDVQPTTEDLKMVSDLMHTSSEIGQYEDRSRNPPLLESLSAILGAEVQPRMNPDGTRPDGVMMLRTCNTEIAYLFLEAKREFGEGGCDPTTQVSLSMRRSWIHSEREKIRAMCCCPTFLIAAGGPWLVVLGSVFTDKFIVQRLTDIKWMAHSSTEEDNRVYHNARVFVALRESLTKLQNFYMALQSPDHPPPFFTNQPHPRYFPYPTSFTERGSTTHFKYLTSLEEDSACVTYLAEVVDETGTTKDPKEIVVIKFVARYGRNVHEFLASKGFAPSLRYYGSFTPKLDGVYPGPAQNAPPGLCLRSDQMHMVVMEYINAPPNTLPNTQLNDDHKIQIEDILTLLHSEGYVFGDLRRLNILLGADGKVRLIDFNWCGRYDMKAKIPDGILPDKLRKMINENKDRVHGQLGNGPYVYYPLSISTVEGMWAEGMEPLLEIRPEHDWLMLHKLFPLPTA